MKKVALTPVRPPDFISNSMGKREMLTTDFNMHPSVTQAVKILESSRENSSGDLAWRAKSVVKGKCEVRFLSPGVSSINWNATRKAVQFCWREEQVQSFCDIILAWYDALPKDEQERLTELVVILTDEMEWIPPVHFREKFPCVIPMDNKNGLSAMVFVPLTHKGHAKEQESKLLASIIAHELEHVFQLLVSLKQRDLGGEDLSLTGWSTLGFIEMAAILAEFRANPGNRHLLSYGADFLRHLHMGFLPAGGWYYFFPFLKRLWDVLGDEGDPREVWRGFDPTGEGPWFDYDHLLQRKGSSIMGELVAFYQSIFDPEDREELLGLILDRYGSPTPSAVIKGAIHLEDLLWHPSGMHVIELLPNTPLPGKIDVAIDPSGCPYTALGRSRSGEWICLAEKTTGPTTLELPENTQFVLLINLEFPRPSIAADRFLLTRLGLQFQF